MGITQQVIHLDETDIDNFIRWRSVIGSSGSKMCLSFFNRYIDMHDELIERNIASAAVSINI